MKECVLVVFFSLLVLACNVHLLDLPLHFDFGLPALDFEENVIVAIEEDWLTH